MANKILNTRIKQKIDTEANWIASDIILLLGETAYVVDSMENPTVLKFKVGNGVNSFADLPYASANALDVLVEAKDRDSLKALITQIAGEVIDSKFSDGLLLYCGGADPEVNTQQFFDASEVEELVEQKLNNIVNSSY